MPSDSASPTISRRIIGCSLQEKLLYPFSEDGTRNEHELQDGYNIGWKLASVLTGRAGAELLQTYDLDRHKTAADLIEFDRYFTNLFSTAAKGEASPEISAEGFIKPGKYTAGLTTA